MARTPLTVREWLEDMRTYASRDGDRAKELLDLLDEGEAAEVALEQATEWWASLHALCVEAGLLHADDHATNPLPLLRMFLPVD